MNVLVYRNHFLELSETFIYNQVVNMPINIVPYVVCNKRANIDKFPYDKVIEIKHANLLKIYALIVSKLTKCNRNAMLKKLYANYIFKIVDKHGIDLLHIHFGTNLFHFNEAFLDLAIPIVVTFHGFDASSKLHDPIYKEKILKAFEKDNIFGFAVSNNIKNNLCSIGLPESKISVQYIGINPTVFLPKEKKSISRKSLVKLIQVSRFVEKKGHIFTLQAVNQLLLDGYDVELNFVGSGPLLSDIQQKTVELKMSDKVHFLMDKSSHEINNLLRESDIFILHSITAENGDQEGLPIVLMEAMSIGLPIISTKHSGIPELVQDGVDGYLVAEKDVDGYVGAMKKAIEEYGLLAIKSVDKINESFNVIKNCGKMAFEYENIIQSVSRGAE